MALVVRPIAPADAPEAGRICYEAFRAIATAHNFPPDLPDRDVTIGMMSELTTTLGFYGIVDERSAVVGLGPITVDPTVQNGGVGKALMTHMIDRAEANRAPGLRLVQSGYHARSLCLYTRLGFDPREHLVILQGAPLGLTIPGCTVRPAAPADLDACNRLCRAVHGHDRGGAMRDAISHGTASVVERASRITGYTTEIAFFGHAVAETNDDLKALIAAAPAFGGPGFLLPSRNAELFRWCLEHKLRMVQAMTLMTMGLYNEPQGAYLPSILY
jgi:GNAT superfamily N-acetyltransferase